MVRAARRRGEATKPRTRVRPYRPPTIARKRGRRANRRPALSRGWGHDQFNLAQSPYGPFYSLFMIAMKWLITLMSLGAGFGLAATTLYSGPHRLGADITATVLGLIFLGLGWFFLMMTPAEVSELAMRRFKGP
jgi:hypothetical protein